MILLPFPTDTRRTLYLKILTFWQENLASPRLAANDPLPTDTVRTLLVKWLRAIQGI